MSCGVIHVKNYVLKVSTIGEVGLKLVADSNHCECPKSISAYYSFQNNVQLLVPESLSHLSPVGTVGMKIRLMPGTRASRKGLLDGAEDPPGFNAGMIDPAYSSRDVRVNLTLQLTKRESLSVI